MKAQALPDENTVSRLMEKLPAGAPKRRPKYIVVVIAAAAALGALTITAGAVTGWTFNFLGNPSTVFDSATIEEYNAVTEASYSNSFSDYGFELTGAATDGNLLRLIVDIFPPEGQTFTEENIPVMYKDIFFSLEISDIDGACGIGGGYYIIEQTPEKLRLGLRYDCTLPMDGRDLTLKADKNLWDEEGRLIETKNLWISNITTVESKAKIVYENIDRTKLVFPAMPDSGIDYESYITPIKAEVGFMSVTLYGFVSQNSPMPYLQRNKPYITLSDGSAAELLAVGGGSIDDGTGISEGDMTFEMRDAVEPSDIVSITLNGHEIIFR